MSKLSVFLSMCIALLFVSAGGIVLAQESVFLPLTPVNSTLAQGGGGGNNIPATPTSTDSSEATPTAIPSAVPTQPPTGSDACPNETFIDLQPHPANSAYPDPALDVTCTATQMVVQTNNIPNFEFVSITPNGLSAQEYVFRLPLEPTLADAVTDVPLMGASAVSVNGLAIFGPTESPATGSNDPYLDGILDFCNGHTAQRGDYHFHARPDCIFDGLDQATAENVGRVVAYAFDGFPILAPYLCEDAACTSVKELQSSWVDANPGLSNAWERHEYVAGTGDLDECNGMTLDNGSYVYFATDTFPYFMGCYRGTVEESNFPGERPATSAAAAGSGSGLLGRPNGPGSGGLLRQMLPPRR